MAEKVWFWGIDGYEDGQLIFQCAVEQEKLSDAGVIATLRCLVSRHLGPQEIVVANLGNNTLLEVRQHEPNPKYVKYSCGGKYQYTAALWQSEIT